jgi:isopenicillin N synthase-like dioxygenase
LHYPAEEHNTHTIRGNIHSDFGTLTLLVQDAVGGLQVQRTDGTWIMVQPRANAIIVNVGDMLMRWTNDKLQATLHQVVTPPGVSKSIPERFSIAFFCNANKETLLECLENCSDNFNPPRYPPINAYDYLTQRLTDTIHAGENSESKE